MQQLAIRALGACANILALSGLLGIVLAAAALSARAAQEGGTPVGGAVAAAALFLGGLVVLTLFVGLIQLGLGIHRNTQRLADAMERLARAL